MKKKFNITGVCFEEEHYMVDTSAKMQEIMDLINNGQYFTINRPRQYGKTTTLEKIMKALKGKQDYLGLQLTFERFGSDALKTEELFVKKFMSFLLKELKYQKVKFKDFTYSQLKEQTIDFDSLSDTITAIVEDCNKKVVVLIDEVDHHSNYDLFLEFLAMLRSKYLERRRYPTFHSIILAGVHDVKNLKYKIKKESDTYQRNSPWNIAASFDVKMSFNPKEITPMLEEYSKAEKLTMDIPVIAEKLYYYTSGYPFLVSALCKIIAEKIMPKKTIQTWTIKEVDEAVEHLIQSDQINITNFQTLIKNLENDKELYDWTYRILFESKKFIFNSDDPLTNLGLMHGIFKRQGNSLKIHNRIYEERIYRYMTAKTIRQLNGDYDYGFHFTLPNNALDLEAALLKFQELMKQEYSKKDISFLERYGRLVFLAFLKPILNGKGHSFKEVETSMEKRLDIVVTYFQHKYIIELKRWYGPKAHEKGLQQLEDYLNIQGEDTGFLLIFEHNKQKSWRKEWIKQGDKRVFAIWV